LGEEIKYKTVYLDPPWLEVGGGEIKRGADRHYPLMATDEIISLLLREIRPQLEDDCHMYMWVTNNFLEDGLKVIKKLGFRYVTTITWMKNQQGLGQYFRGVTEHCLFAVRGNLPYKVKNGKRQQGRTGFVANKKEHSVKPETMREMIERVSYAPYLEVFARRPSKGWSVWGNEVNGEEIERIFETSLTDFGLEVEDDE
jgi:N6-adenosine-specific RNA methylase IME4